MRPKRKRGVRKLKASGESSSRCVIRIPRRELKPQWVIEHDP